MQLIRVLGIILTPDSLKSFLQTGRSATHVPKVKTFGELSNAPAFSLQVRTLLTHPFSTADAFTSHFRGHIHLCFLFTRAWNFMVGKQGDRYASRKHIYNDLKGRSTFFFG